ncbi:MAG: Ig-like domain-containing protein, partial [Candidatus Hadarchaeales archaeon]
PDGGSWINSSSAAFSWSGSDSHSGINNYEYRTSTDGGSTWSSWTSTTSTSYTWSNLSSSTNYYKIQVRAKDVAGNYSSAVEWSFRVDGTAPSNPTSCSDSAGSSNNTWQNSITDPNFSWSGASDSHSGIAGYYYYWGTDPNGTSTNYTTSAAYDPPAVSSDGVYYLRVQTGDAAGNTSSWITIYTFKLDRGAPSGSATAPSHTWSTESNITLSCSDNLSGVSAAKYNWDSPADATTGTSYSNGQSITAPEGVHTLYLWVRDVAGNTSTWSGTYYIDTTAPPAPIVSSSTHPNPENWYSNPSVSFTWSSEENLSGIQGYYYYWGTDASGTPDIWTTSTSGTLTASSDGTWYFRIKAKNGSGLESPVASFQVNIDATPPPAPSVGSPTHPNENTWYQDNNPVFSWACDDLSGIAGYSYALDAPPDDTIDTTDTTVSFSNVSDGVHIFYVKAKNKVGLWGATASYTIRVWVIPESAPSPPKPSTLRIWPPGFSIKKGENLVLTVILLDPEGRPLGGKTIDWSANLGTLVPPSLATDELGRASVLYFAPEVEADTPVVVTVSFAGDESYTSSAAFFFGWVTSPRTTEILENLERAAERIGLLIEKVEEKLAVFEAVVEGRIGASLTVTIEVGVPGLWKEYEAENFRTQLRRAKTGELVEVVVENVRPARGTTILLNIENGVIPVGQIREVLVDNVPAGLADDYEDILDPTDDGGRCEYLILKGGRGAQILVSIPGFSSRTITIRGPLAAGKPWVPLVIAINIVVIVVVLLLVFQRRPRSY